MAHEVTQADVDRAIRYAAAYARKSGTPSMLDEWESAALVGLAEASASFDPALGFAFWTHAAGRVYGSVLDCARSWEPKGYGQSSRVVARRDGLEWTPPPKTQSIHDVSGDGEGKPLSVKDTIPDGTEPVGWEAEWHDELARHAGRLPSTVAAPFAVYYGAAPTRAAAARLCGVSKSRVSQCLETAHAMLADHYAITERIAAMTTEAPAAHANGNGTAETLNRSEPCPKCGTLMSSLRRRCYQCTAGGKPHSAAVPPAAPPDAVTPVPVPRHAPPAEAPAVVGIALLRQFARAIASLNDDDARWAVETAYRESRSR